MPDNLTPLILASGSRYRQQQLRQLGLAFTARPADIDEAPRPTETAEVTAVRLAEAKARAVEAAAPESAFIIGCDQTADCNGQRLGKPGSVDNAQRQLERCSGQQVIFHSALCVLEKSTGQTLTASIPTRVQFRPLSNRQIERYIALENPLDCAGSFKCEGLGIALFESIDSHDPSALVGLPLIQLTSFLLELGFEIP